MTKTPPLFKHQKKTVAFLGKTPRSFDMSDPGTGKTRSHIEAVARRMERDKRKTIVLAPKSILQSAWGEDISSFANHLKYNVAYAENRADAFEDDADVYITNLDAVTWLAKQKPSFFKGRFAELIIDESTAYKHHTSQRSKAANKVAQYFELRRELSGSPNPNGMVDLWHQVKLLDGGKRLGQSFFAYRSAVCAPEQTGPLPEHVRWVDREGAELAVSSLLRDITIRHVLEECIDMPPNHLYHRNYVLPAKHAAYYHKLQNDSILNIRENKITAVNGAVLYNKLLQAASGAVYDENGKYVVLDSGRYELIADLCEQRKHSLVFFQWAHQRDLLVQEFEKRGLSFMLIDGSVTRKGERERAVEYFQKGFYRVGLLHPQSAGHGLTLTRATHSIWASPTVNAEWWKQANHRAYRAGQTQRTETIVIVAKGTVDETVYSKNSEKVIRMSSLLGDLAA